MKTMKNIKKHYRSLRKDKRGIDTILAALLMVVIVVVASVMVYAWSTGLLGALMVTPQVGKEAMNIENSAFTNSTWATIYLRNTGTASISLVTYYVKDNANNQYSKTSWSTYTGIAPNALATVNIDINAPTHCGCTAASNAFQFVSGNSYTVIVVTSRNSQFTFTIVR